MPLHRRGEGGGVEHAFRFGTENLCLADGAVLRDVKPEFDTAGRDAGTDRPAREIWRHLLRASLAQRVSVT